MTIECCSKCKGKVENVVSDNFFILFIRKFEERGEEMENQIFHLLDCEILHQNPFNNDLSLDSVLSLGSF